MCLTVYEELDSAVLTGLYKRARELAPTPEAAESLKAKELFAGADKVYAPKCYCLLSSVPCYTFGREWLNVFFENAFKSTAAFCVEACIAHLVKGVPMPAPMGIPLRVTFAGTELSEVAAPSPEFPSTDFPYRLILDSLSLENIVAVFRALLLEEKVVFISTSKSLLTYTCELFAALLWPLKWPHVFVPILPRQLLDIADTPTPFLVGVLSSYASAIKSGTFSQTVRVDLDKDTVAFPRPLPELPPSEGATLMKDLKKLCAPEREQLDSVGWHPWHRQPTPSSGVVFQSKVRAAFFKCMLSLLNSYRKYILYLRAFSTTIIVFDKRKFQDNRLSKAARDGQTSDPSAFFDIFLDTQAFTSFLELHKKPSSNIVDNIHRRGHWKSSKVDLSALFLQPPRDEYYTVNLKCTIPAETEAEAPTRSQCIIPLNYNLAAGTKVDRPHRHKVRPVATTATSPRQQHPAEEPMLPSSRAGGSLPAGIARPRFASRGSSQAELPKALVTRRSLVVMPPKAIPSDSPLRVKAPLSQSASDIPAATAEAATTTTTTALAVTRVPPQVQQQQQQQQQPVASPSLPVPELPDGPRVHSPFTVSTSLLPASPEEVRRFDRSASDLSAASVLSLLHLPDGLGDLPSVATASSPTPTPRAPELVLSEPYRTAVRAFSQSLVVADGTGELSMQQMSLVLNGIDSEDGRVLFANELLRLRENSTEVGKIVRLKGQSFALLGDTIRKALECAAPQGDIWSPQQFVEVSEIFYQIVDGASSFVSTRLHGLAMWQKAEFWESYFFAKCSDMIRSLYNNPSLEKHFHDWASKSQADKEQANTIEAEAVWKLIATFAFKMVSLAVTPKIVKRFALKMCNKLCLDDAQRKTIVQLVTNMSKLQLIDVEDDPDPS